MRAIEKRLRERIKFLESEIADIKEDREKFRDYFSKDLKWLIDIHGKGTSPAMSAYITDRAKFLSRVKWFVW